MQYKTAGMGADQKQFIKTLGQLTYTQSGWQAWADFVTLTACSIANAVDQSERWQKREDMYMQIAGRYKREELELFGQLFAYTVEALERDPEQDFLGELFMALELGSHWHGQFFTPYHVCELMAQIQISANDEVAIREKEYISVNDPACGAGALLIAAANAFKASGINYQEHVEFVAQDIDFTAAMMCYIQTSLLGCPGYVIVGDTLAMPPVDPLPENYEVWYTPFWFAPVWRTRRLLNKIKKYNGRFDSNPDEPVNTINLTEVKTGQLKFDI